MNALVKSTAKQIACAPKQPSRVTIRSRIRRKDGSVSTITVRTGGRQRLSLLIRANGRPYRITLNSVKKGQKPCIEQVS